MSFILDALKKIERRLDKLIYHEVIDSDAIARVRDGHDHPQPGRS